MSDYELIRGGQKLNISPGVDHDHVYITVGDDDDSYIFAAWHDDTPAVALAILEAAMTDDSPHADPVALQNCRAWLRAHIEQRGEDEKVRAYLHTVLLNPVSYLYRITDHDRAEYARAAEFFQGEQ